MQILQWLAVALAAGLVLQLPGAAASAAGGLELYLAEDLSFALYKPPAWEVKTTALPGARMLVVADPTGRILASAAVLTSDDETGDAVAFAGRNLAAVRGQDGSLELGWARSAKDRHRTVVQIRKRRADGTEVRGRYYFSVDHPLAQILGYEAPAGEFSGEQPRLLSILANITPLDAQQLGGAARKRAAASPVLPTSPRRLADGSASMQVPGGWNFIGAKGSALAHSPDGSTGFAFITAEFYGPSSVPYFDSSRIPGVRHAAYMQPIDALAVVMTESGSRNIRSVKRIANPTRASEATRAIDRSADAELALLSFDSEQGVACQGFYDVIGYRPLPSGQWMIIAYGIWAPAAQFDAMLPSLARISQSYRINQGWAKAYIAQGLANLQVMIGRTIAMARDAAVSAREASYASFRERMRSQDYIDYKRTAYIRGEQEWVSRLEGGQLYTSDRWGLRRDGQHIREGREYNYYNYQGESPHYNEQLTPVDTSREVYESVYGAGR